MLEPAGELVSAALFAALFAVFVIQVFMRYVVGKPVGWTLELTLVLFLWVTFWNAALLLKERDHVAFDLLYQEMPAGVQRVLALLGTGFVVAAFAVSFLPSLDYVTFMTEDGAELDSRYPLRLRLLLLHPVPGRRRRLRCVPSGGSARPALARASVRTAGA